MAGEAQSSQRLKVMESLVLSKNCRYEPRAAVRTRLSHINIELLEAWLELLE